MGSLGALLNDVTKKSNINSGFRCCSTHSIDTVVCIVPV
jgi:hypothetical protein